MLLSLRNIFAFKVSVSLILGTKQYFSLLSIYVLNTVTDGFMHLTVTDVAYMS